MRIPERRRFGVRAHTARRAGRVAGWLAGCMPLWRAWTSPACWRSGSGAKCAIRDYLITVWPFVAIGDLEL